MRCLFCAALVALACAPFSAWAAEADPAVVGRAIDGFVRPAYAAFHETTGALDKAAKTLCAAPDAAGLDAARTAFDATVAAWSRVEIVRLGPVTEDNRLERILFWPDRKSIGLKQVQAALAAKDETATTVDSLTGKSVAVQGLGALEFVLFGTGSEDLAAGDAHRCAFGAAIAGNLDAIAGSLEQGWNGPDGFSARWTQPAADNPLYRNDTEALNELAAIFVNGLELIRDQRLNGFLGREMDDDKPKQALFWRSRNTVATLAGNVAGLKALFGASGYGRSPTADAAAIVTAIDAEFDKALAAAQAADAPVADLLADPVRRASLIDFGKATSRLSDLVGKQLSAKLGLSAGFSSLDGD